LRKKFSSTSGKQLTITPSVESLPENGAMQTLHRAEQATSARLAH